MNTAEQSKHYVVPPAMPALATLVLCGCLGAPSAAQTAAESRQPLTPSILPEPQALDPSVVRPEAIVGHQIGDGAVRYDAALRYFTALADESPLVTLRPYAKSHEGRTLFYLTITSRNNQARLDAIRSDNARLADPRLLESEQQAQDIITDLPGIAWLAYGIHGDELSSTDAAVLVAYQLAAGTDERTRQLREQLVIHIDPMMNPDGRERYLQQLQHLTGKVPNPDYQSMQHRGLWSAGRGNHYLFDLNRDWLMQVHPETRGRVAQLLQWQPHLVVDSHEMGALDTYLFDPPRKPFNVNLSDKNLEWRRRFSADQARAFDEHGWSYYTQEWYEEWYPGYTNAWANLLGAVGILYEQAGVNATQIKQASGEILTYHQAVHHHFVSSLSNLESLRANRQEILSDFYNDRRWAVNTNEGPVADFILPATNDRPRLQRLLDLLKRQGVEVYVAQQDFQAHELQDRCGTELDNKTFAQGTFVVRQAQPHRRLLRSLLGFDPHMSEGFLIEERRELENRRSSRIYDITAWNLGMAYGLEAYWGQMPEVSLARLDTSHPDQPSQVASSKYGYLIDGASNTVYPLLGRLFDRQCNVRCADKPFTFDGRVYAPGTLLLRNNENPENAQQLLVESAAGLDVHIHPANTALSQQGPDLGGSRFVLLSPPRVAIASQWPMSTTSFGAVWQWLDDRMGVRSSPLNVQYADRADLRKYNVLILPHAWNVGALDTVLAQPARDNLRRWIQEGGTLIAIGGSAAFVAGEQAGLSQVRTKREVLDKLSIYEEAVKHERAARAVKVDPQTVWGTAEPAQPDVEKPTEDSARTASEVKEETEALKRKDEYQRIFSPRGVFVQTVLDQEHWLCFGLGSTLPALVGGSYALMSTYPVRTPVRLAGVENVRLSGLMWPEARQRWAETSYATVERLGRGQIILFQSDPVFRGYLEGCGRLFSNAVFFGPGMGTSQPVPW